jgi:molybdopterin converting factor small subunit
MSEITVRIPTPLRRFTGGAAEVTVAGGDVGEVLQDLVARHEGLRSSLFDGDGGLRSFVNVYLDDQNIRSLDRLATPVNGAKVVHIVPAVAGGRR